MLKTLRNVLWGACLSLGFLASQGTTMAAESPSPIYELRVYTCEAGSLPALLERFRDHTCRLFEKHGMKNVAYFVPAEGPDAELKLIYFLEHKNREAATASFQAFREDSEWKKVRTASEEKYGKILAMPVESTFLKLTDYSPTLVAPSPEKIYELRIYSASEGKFDALNARFRDVTLRLFEKHGIRNVAYWNGVSPEDATTKLFYLLEHDSVEAANKAFQAFREDPEWKKALVETQKNGSLSLRKPESVFLKATDFSPHRAN